MASASMVKCRHVGASIWWAEGDAPTAPPCSWWWTAMAMASEVLGSGGGITASGFGVEAGKLWMLPDGGCLFRVSSMSCRSCLVLAIERPTTWRSARKPVIASMDLSGGGSFGDGMNRLVQLWMDQDDSCVDYEQRDMWRKVENLATWLGLRHRGGRASPHHRVAHLEVWTVLACYFAVVAATTGRRGTGHSWSIRPQSGVGHDHRGIGGKAAGEAKIQVGHPRGLGIKLLDWIGVFKTLGTEEKMRSKNMEYNHRAEFTLVVHR